MDSYLLAPEELESLRELTFGSVRRRIKSAHAVKLVELGLARETADGVLITNRGRARLAMNEARYARRGDDGRSRHPAS